MSYQNSNRGQGGSANRPNRATLSPIVPENNAYQSQNPGRSSGEGYAQGTRSQKQTGGSRRHLTPEQRKKKKQALQRARIGQILFFPLMIFFMELVFHWSVRGSLSFIAFCLILLYSFAVGWVLMYVPLSLIRNEKARNITGYVLISLFSLPFLVEFFVAKAFKVLYDLKTVVKGAGGVATGFLSDTLKLIFSFSGLSRIFLLLVLPILIYTFFVKKWMKRTKHNWKKTVFIGVSGLACFFVALIGIGVNSRLSNLHNKNYSFENAVDQFGLLTGLRLEVVHLNDKSSFTAETGIDPLAIGEESTAGTSVVPSIIPGGTGSSAQNGAQTGSTENSGGEGEESSALDQTAALENIIGIGNLITGYSRMDIDFDQLAKEA